MNIKLQGVTPPGYVSIEKWDIEYPFSLNINAIFPKKCIWVDNLITSVKHTDISSSIGFKFRIDVRRKLFIHELANKKQNDTPDEFPPLKKKQESLWYGLNNRNSSLYPFWSRQKDTWIQSGNDKRIRARTPQDDANKATQHCIFEDIPFALVLKDARFDNILIKPLMQTIPDFFFKKNINDANETIEFVYKYSASRISLYGENPSDESLEFFMNLEYK